MGLGSKPMGQSIIGFSAGMNNFAIPNPNCIHAPTNKTDSIANNSTLQIAIDKCMEATSFNFTCRRELEEFLADNPSVY